MSKAEVKKGNTESCMKHMIEAHAAMLPPAQNPTERVVR